MGERAVHRSNTLLELFNEQSGVCAYCFKTMTLELQKPETATIEHIDARSRGGARRGFNIVAACAGCNSNKSDKDFASWIKPRAFG